MLTRGAARILFAKALFICLCVVACVAADAPRLAAGKASPERNRLEDIQREKASLLLDKARKADRKGEYAEAAEAYEDSYLAFPGNVKPLLEWGNLLCRLGQYDQARAVLKRIPLKQLAPVGQAGVNILFAKISIAAGELEQAAGFFQDALKTQPESAEAKIRLALLHEHFGLSQRKEELIRDLQGRESLSYRNRSILFLLELGSLMLVDAFEDALLLSMQMEPAGGSGEAFIRFASSLPIGFSGVSGFLYALLLMTILAWIATLLAPIASKYENAVFVMLAVAHIMAASWWGISDARIALLADEFSIYDSVWILPRLLIAMHMVTVSLFIAFPLFYLLPVKMRPKRSELYAIWFFCWWFMTFVLVFQSRLGIMLLLPGILASLLFAGLAAIWMPLGKFLMFHCVKITGLSRVMPSIRVKEDGAESFSDAKLQEAQAGSRLEAEDFEAVIRTGKKLFALHDRDSFPEMHLFMIGAYIEQEDLYESRKILSEFQSRFGDSKYAHIGSLMEALLKSMEGDFAGALKTINSIPAARIASFGGDETALSLLVTGRCNAAFEQPQQAHVDWTRGLDHARLPLVRASILSELARLDFLNGRSEWTARWRDAADKLGGGDKTRAFVKMIRSIALAAADSVDAALQDARGACEAFRRCGPAFAWYGHLLCLKGKHADAQALLEKMTAGTAAGRLLMEKITARS